MRTDDLLFPFDNHLCPWMERTTFIDWFHLQCLTIVCLSLFVARMWKSDKTFPKYSLLWKVCPFSPAGVNYLLESHISCAFPVYLSLSGIHTRSGGKCTVSCRARSRLHRYKRAAESPCVQVGDGIVVILDSNHKHYEENKCKVHSFTSPTKPQTYEYK